MQSLLVGIDGGGTKTRAIVADERGEPLAEALAAGSAVKPGEVERSAGIIVGLVRDALENAGKADEKPRVVYVGVAGVGRETERQALWDSLVGHQIAEDIVVQPDYLTA